MRIFVAVILAACFSASDAIAQSILAPGKPAGVTNAMSSERREIFILAGAGVIVVGALAVLLSEHKKTTPSVSTSP